MNKHFKAALFLSLVVILTGCETLQQQQRINSTTTSFSDPAFKVGGSIAIIAADEVKNSSLEFAHFRKIIADKLTFFGYQVVEDLNVANQVAIVSYGIDNGRSKLVSTPVYGQIGGGTSYTSGTVTSGSGFGTYSGTTYSIPQFGVVGSSSDTVTVYSRALAIDLVDGASFRSGNTKKLLEIRTSSSGSCGNITPVLPFIIDATFAVFPGESGVVRNSEIPLAVKIC